MRCIFWSCILNTLLRNDVIMRLFHDFSFKENGEWFQQGRCPECQKKELYTGSEAPWLLRCGRLSKCGVTFHIKELYPDLFESFSTRYVVTQENPTASADAFMIHARGLDLSNEKRIYTQDAFFDSRQQIGSATVRFKIADGVYWERLIDKAHRFNRKANFIGDYKGRVWQHPVDDIANEKEIWLTEGIFDALALRAKGICAVSVMSCGNYPSLFLEHLKTINPKVQLVVAFDCDNAGKKFTRKHVNKLKEEGWTVTAAQPPFSKRQSDWNDLYQHEKLSPKDLETYRYYGQLLLANTASEKSLLMHERTGHQEFQFEFFSRLFSFKLDLNKFEKSMAVLETDESLSRDEVRNKAMLESGSVTEIANCYPTALYYQANTVTDEAWYYFKIEFPSGESVKNTFTGGQLASSSEFKKRLLHIAKGGLYTGSAGQLDKIMLQQLHRIKTVETLDFTGYSARHQCYILGNLAVFNGNVIPVNDEDFFDVGKNSVKSLMKIDLDINSNTNEYCETWVPLLWNSFGEKGLISLVYWFGSLFSEQIRQLDKSFPFLEIVGDPGSGKTTIIEFMWKLFGRENYEGFDPSKSTPAGRSRSMSQVSNMPVVLIEGDRRAEAKKAAFEYDELKSLYNGRSIRSRGVNTSGNHTYEPPFRGSIVIAQNDVIDASPAVLERIIHIYTDKRSQNESTKIAAETLERMPIQSVSGFILKSTMAEKSILCTYAQQKKKYEQILAEHNGIHHIRLIKNHAQIMALLDALSEIIPLKESWVVKTQERLIQMTLERQRAVQADHPFVQEFWEIFEFLDVHSGMVNHSNNPDEIAINMNQFYQVAMDWKQPIPALIELRKLLKQGTKYKFITQKSTKSAVNVAANRTSEYKNKQLPQTVRCFVFKKDKYK